MAAFRFAFLLQLARDEREEAARVMQEAQASWLQAQAKLEQLDQYRIEYRQRLVGSGGLSVTQLRDYQLFLGKLDQVHAQQQGEITRLHAAYEQARDAWLACERKVKAFEALEVRHQQNEQRRENRQEQKLIDEFNSRPRQ